jgi:DNA polymerase-3 subunit beta
MFELTISKAQLLTPLLTVAGAVDKKQVLPILSHLLLKRMDDHLLLTATDLDIEMTARVPFEHCAGEGGAAITVPAKKFIDIIRSLEDNAVPRIRFDAGIVSIKEGRSQFKLATLPAEDYPNNEEEANEFELTVAKDAFVHLLQSTHFAMGQQDVRVFLNGLFLEIDAQFITAVAMDGHRMAICRLPCQLGDQHQRLLLPRKGVQEILRLLNQVTDETVSLSFSKQHFKLISQQYTFYSKLIEARFPAYSRAIPRVLNKQVTISRDLLKRALSRIIILANEKSRAVLMEIQPGQLTLIANNQEQEEAIESLAAETEGDALKIGVNAAYVLDFLQHVEDGPLRLSMSDTDSSILLESLADAHYSYVLMPMTI